MGEPPVRGIDRNIDCNDRLRRIYYEDAPRGFRRIRLGQAVAASACVPGLFEPLVLDRLYQGHYVLKLVDGGVFDNQGASSLHRQDCTVLLVSDASGQTGIEKRPVGDRIGVSLRSNSVLMARIRQEQYQWLSVTTEAGLLRGFAYVHLKKDLDAEPVDWIDCPDPSRKDKQTVLTSYGMRKDIQKRLAAIRTDLDSFSDAEADALALSGYLMMTEEFKRNVSGFPVSSSTDPEWRFLDIAPVATSVTPMPELDELKRVLDVAHSQALKAFQLSTGLKVATVFSVLAAVAGLAALIYSLQGLAIPVNGLLAVLSLAAIGAGAAKLLLRYVFRNPNPLWQVIAAVPLLFIGLPLLLFFTAVIDPIYLRAGPRYRKSSR
jgi:hypothetical protein